MIVDLDKEGLVDLLQGVGPNYHIMSLPFIESMGAFSENNGWQWDNHKLYRLSESGLYDLYILCRESWGSERHSWLKPKDEKVPPPVYPQTEWNGQKIVWLKMGDQNVWTTENLISYVKNRGV
jgi:hypothetical protein